MNKVLNLSQQCALQMVKADGILCKIIRNCLLYAEMPLVDCWGRTREAVFSIFCVHSLVLFWTQCSFLRAYTDVFDRHNV